MAGHHFISYSRVDASGFAERLALELSSGVLPFKTWSDENHIRAGEDWDVEIDKGIRTCECLLFLMTPDSVRDRSECKNEWGWALKYKKRIIPLLIDPDAETPYGLGVRRQHIDFTHDFDQGLNRLRIRLEQLHSPEETLQALEERLEDAERALNRSSDSRQRTRAQSIATQGRSAISGECSMRLPLLIPTNDSPRRETPHWASKTDFCPVLPTRRRRLRFFRSSVPEVRRGPVPRGVQRYP